MAELIFEIWTDADNDSCEVTAVSAQGDKLRHLVSPNAHRVHSFTARSDFEAYQASYDWHGWGVWHAPENQMERHFTEEEAAEQRRYLAVRKGG